MDRWIPNANLGLIAEWLQHRDSERLLVICEDDETGRQLRMNLRSLLEEPVCFLPGWNQAPEAETRPEPVIQNRRLQALRNLDGSSPILITTPGGLGTRILHPDSIEFINLNPGQTIDPVELTAKLTELGYGQQDLVAESGDFSRRGDLVDVYPPDHELPVRLEFFDQQLESIEYFHPNTQMIADRELDTPVTIYPQSEFLCDSKRIDQFRRELPDQSPLDQPLSKHNGPLHWFLGEFDRETPYPDELLDPEKILIFNHQKINQGIQSWDQSLESLAPDHPTRTTHRELDSYLKTQSIPITTASPREEPPSRSANRLEIGTALSISGSYGLESEPIDRFLERIEETVAEVGKVYVHADQQSLLDRLSTLLEQRQNETEQPLLETVEFINKPWRGSYQTTDKARLSLDDFFNRTVNRESLGPRTGRTEYLESFEDLHGGDLVVHEDFGVGRFHGMRRVHSAGQTRDCLDIEYADEDRLFLPPDQINRVQKYLADSGFTPSLSSLSGNRWNRVKQRVREDLEELAEDLLELYMNREQSDIEPLPETTVEQAQFEASFPHRETPDQQRAIRETKQDLDDPTPMNRLVCGDSGYGKTEVALRAAFQVASNHRQVAVLVPTTVLARQHGRTFEQRFSTFPYEVGVLSRFTEPDEESRIIKELETGELDIVIGTHRLLGDDIEFDNLGLLVIDEEQRFGVQQKEELKFDRENVNVLTLSATPIPRTLYMSLSGMQDISVINSPPEERNPINISVGTFDRHRVSDGLHRELDRDGQVFWIKNRVKQLPEEAEFVQSLAPPGTEVEIAHGQMGREQLRDTMNRFYEGEIDILVCTTIVEAGLDCPNANTMIVRNAHMYGLAQLYQLRGRIGRSHRKATAHLLYPANIEMSEDAEARLETIKRSAELGSGFEIAMRDLEIRGAGSLLGKNQHGNIRAIGFPLYCKLLQRTVRRLREGFEVPEPFPKLPLPGEYHLPEEYIPDEQTRIRQYQSLASCRQPEEVDELEAHWKSTFGPLPDPAVELLNRHRFKIQAAEHGWKDFRYQNNRLNLIAESGENLLKQGARSIGANLINRGSRTFVKSLSPDSVSKFLKSCWTQSEPTRATAGGSVS